MVEDSSPLRGPVSSEASPPASRELVRDALEIGLAYAEEAAEADGGIEHCEIGTRKDVETLRAAIANTPDGWRDIDDQAMNGEAWLVAIRWKDEGRGKPLGGPLHTVRAFFSGGEWFGFVTEYYEPYAYAPLPQPPEVK